MRSPAEPPAVAAIAVATLGLGRSVRVLDSVVEGIAPVLCALWLRVYINAPRRREGWAATRCQGAPGSSGRVREGGGVSWGGASVEGRLRIGRALDAATAAASRRPYESSIGVSGPRSSVGVVKIGIGTGNEGEGGGAKRTWGSGGIGCVGGGSGLDRCLVRARSAAKCR